MNSDELLRSSHKIASVLLSGGSNALKKTLEELAAKSGVSRVYIFEICHDIMNNIMEYVNPAELKADDNPNGIEPEIDNLQNLPLDAFPDWISWLQNGETINAFSIHEYGFKEETHRILYRQNIKSVLVMPIFLADELYGFVGFDECKYFRKWDVSIVEYLEMNVGNIALFLKNQRASDDLTESRRSYQDLVNLLPQSLFEIDLEGNFIFANAFGLDHFGYTQKDIDEGFNVLELFPKEQRSRVKANIEKILRGEDLKGNEYIAVKKDGTEVSVLIYSSPIMKEYQPIGLRGIVIDITDKKRAERAVIDSERLSAIGEIAAGVAHDFNNALQGIFGHLDLAMNDGNLSDQAKADLIKAYKAAGSAAASVRQLQRFANGRKRLQFSEVVDIKTVLNDGVAQTSRLWREEANRRGLDFEVNVECEKDLTIFGNQGDLRNALYNLIKNSFQAMPEGGTIKLVAKRKGKNVCLRVEDDGLGMDEETQKRIFQPFFSTKGFELGKGMGMSRVYSIVKEHKGNIEVDSRLNQGTTVEISFPYAGKEIVREYEKEYEGSARVLWVDDEDQIRDIAKRIMSSLGHKADVASSGFEALEFLRKSETAGKSYDLVITDIGMPGMSGWQLAEKIKQKYPGMKVAIVTGWGEVPEEKKEKYGVGYVIGKPVGVKQIERLVGEVLQMK